MRPLKKKQAIPYTKAKVINFRIIKTLLTEARADDNGR